MSWFLLLACADLPALPLPLPGPASTPGPVPPASTPAAEPPVPVEANVLAVQTGGALTAVSSAYREDYAGWMAIDDFPRSSWCAGRDTGAGQALTVERATATTFTGFWVTVSDWTGETPTSARVEVDGKQVASIPIPPDAAEFTEVRVPIAPVSGRSVRFVFDGARSAASICVAEVGASGIPTPTPQVDLNGDWNTGWQFGTLHLVQRGAALEGCFDAEGGKVRGTVDGNVAVLDWSTDRGTGIAAMRFLEPGKAAGVTRYRTDGDNWSGAASFQAEHTGPTTVCPAPTPAPTGTAEAPSALEAELEQDRRVVLEGILFDTASDRLRPASTVVLDELVRSLRNHPAWSVTLEGHTDDLGSDGYNQGLSERRAAAVVRYLTEHGVPAARLASKGFGESRPTADNTMALGRARNRRVELVLQ